MVVKDYFTTKKARKYERNKTENINRDLYFIIHCELMVGNYVLLKKGACVPCKLRLGYTGKYMTAIITRIDMVDGKDTDLHIDKPVYAIHLADVREVEE